MGKGGKGKSSGSDLSIGGKRGRKGEQKGRGKSSSRDSSTDSDYSSSVGSVGGKGRNKGGKGAKGKAAVSYNTQSYTHNGLKGGKKGAKGSRDGGKGAGPEWCWAYTLFEGDTSKGRKGSGKKGAKSGGKENGIYLDDLRVGGSKGGKMGGTGGKGKSSGRNSWSLHWSQGQGNSSRWNSWPASDDPYSESFIDSSHRARSKGKGKGKGKGGIMREPRMPDPPVDSDGQWVRLSEFDGRKSFGFFSCVCGRSWTTAHATVEYKQGCQGCEEESHAYYMWQNFGSRGPRQEKEEGDAPHDSDRCEACRLGKCDRATWL